MKALVLSVGLALVTADKTHYADDNSDDGEDSQYRHATLQDLLDSSKLRLQVRTHKARAPAC